MKYSFKDLDLNSRYRLIISFITKLNLTMFLFVLPLFLSNVTTPAINAFIMSMVVIASVVGKFIAGGLGDKFKSKSLLITINILEIVSYILLLVIFMISYLNIHILGLSFIMVSLLSSMRGPVLDALLLDIKDKGKRAYVLTLNYWIFNLALSLGFVIVSFVFKGDIALVIGFGLLTHILVGLIILFVIEFEQVDGGEVKGIDKKISGFNYFSILSNKKYFLFCIGIFLLIGVEFQLPNYIAIQLVDNFSYSIGNYYIDGLKMISILQIINTILILFMPLILRFFQLTKKITFIIGFIFYTFGFSMLLQLDNFFALLLMGLVFTVGEILFTPYHQKVLSELIPENNKVKYMAFYQMTLHSSRLLGTMGILIFSYYTHFISSIIILLLGITGGCLILFASFNVSTNKIKKTA